MTLTREDPAPSRRTRDGASRYGWAEIAEELMRYPGTWFLLRESIPNKGQSGHINAGRIPTLARLGRFQAATRTNDDKTYRIYIRYLGPWSSDEYLKAQRNSRLK